MQPVSRQIEIFGPGCLIKDGQNTPHFFHMLLVETTAVIVFVQAP
ncbi:hypothetical protein DVDV_3953 [Desulfovibrio sp. DV]|nr:hypothetical protein DVDV_3953 [Desulfovibrio sp. DV]